MTMELKEQLKQIFSSDYPGTDVFVNSVIKPIFGDEISFENGDLADKPEYADRARKAGITHINYVGNLTEKNYNADNIVILDVTVDDSKNIERSRVNIQQLIRSIVQQHQHMLVTFHYENVVGRPWRFAWAYKAATIASATSAKRYTYVFGRDYTGRTAAERFIDLANSPRANQDFEKAFSVEALSDEFFNKYREMYADFVQYITGCRYEKRANKWVEIDYGNPNPQFSTSFDNDKKIVRDYIKKMFGRIVFLYFLQRKGWLAGNRNYMRDLWANSTNKDNFLDGVLETLFFGVLNEKPEHRSSATLVIPGSEQMPYLNGGLFAEEEIDRRKCAFSSEMFDRLFKFLDSYNFTIDENDQEDAEIGIDPEMLGRIFENLLEDNKDKGAFYTPKEIVEYMCRESIIAYLQNGYIKESHPLIRQFVASFDSASLSKQQREKLRDKLKEVKICDPAIGSGAFPMGMVNLLAKLYISLGVNSNELGTIKRHIIENNIYGVDIEKGAVDIARLRFWLAMVVEESNPRPLPNLHFKIMQGNSLLENYKGKDLSKLMTGTGDLFADSERNVLNRLVSEFYNVQDHEVRDKKLHDINSAVRRQIYSLTNDEQVGINPSANTKFFLWHTWFADAFEKGGFDIVIGNPPYIKEYTNRDAFNGFRETSPYYKGKMDIWYGFACQAIDHLNQNGILCFIATNNWGTNDGASIFRNKILDDARLLSLIDFNDYLIFEESASIQTMILMLSHRRGCDNYTFDYRKLIKAHPQKADAINLLFTHKSIDNFANILQPFVVSPFLRDNTFNFSTSAVGDILRKISVGASHLSEGEVSQGLIGAPDECFLVDNTNNFNEDEKAYIKPFYTGLADKYVSQSLNAYIIYLSKKNFPHSDLSLYPNLNSHFSEHEERLKEAKIKYKTPDKKYFFLHRERDEKMFMGGYPKIICQGRCLFPRFFYTEEPYYASRALFVLQTSRFDMKFLCGLLNSTLIEFWLRNKGKMQGVNFQVDKKPLMDIPIKSTFKAEQTISAIVNHIVHIKNNDKDADIYSYKNQIDLIVYHLYDLTYDEVLIVNPKTPITHEEYDNFNLD